MDWPLLANLSEGEREELLAAARRRSFARDEIICHAGDPADSLHLVSRGRLAVRVALGSGDSATINILGRGDYFGELALLLEDGHRTATIAALEPAETLVIAASTFHRLCATNPRFERALVALLAHRVDDLSQRLLESMYVGLDRRLHRRLLDLVREYADGSDPVVIPLSQRQLANLVGGTRPSVNVALQRLVDQGIVALSRGKVEILDVASLEGKAER